MSLGSDPSWALTPEESTVLSHSFAGASVAEIARRMRISTAAVYRHLAQIHSKTVSPPGSLTRLR
ncbi:MAG TPA: LuxR C-terminal-related transcriptional regulator [Dehalococcoidia bacterium]|nr:LuxR C-terminal-related transcriptional regulator [Dehalococcoidia bacterium]